jgi:uncharacterized UBP type Zn finger protein
MEIDSLALQILQAYGFSYNCSMKALIATGGQSVDKALDWIGEHRFDDDIDEPYHRLAH